MSDKKPESIFASSGIEMGMREKVISLIVLALTFITFWKMMDIVLMTFILCFVFFKLLIYFQKRICGRFHRKLPDNLVIFALYLLFCGVIGIVSVVFVPKLVSQFGELANIFFSIDAKAVKSAIGPRFEIILEHIDFDAFFQSTPTYVAVFVAKIGHFGFTFLLSVVLSFVILIEKKRISEFGTHMEKSRLSFMYRYFGYFGKNFANTFGKVMRVQVTIAFLNSLLSMLVLSILGFPGILGLGTMIFFLGLIPVAGVVFSFIPLSAIAFGIGGIIKVIEVIVMILLIHGLEAYVLNPKLMASKTRLPAAFVFIILLVGEHYLGVWGLLIGVPIFVFFMNIFEVDYHV